MKKHYHREITTQALCAYFSQDALEQVIVANLGQDALQYQIGHDHYHYDANCFAVADEYCATLRQDVRSALKRNTADQARTYFGRLTHTTQDFYAHSNYVVLWRQSNPNAGPEDIHPELEELVRNPDLISGRLYYPLELLSFIPLFEPVVLPLLPRDSHAWMNKDDPSRPDFAFAFEAAKKRTFSEFMMVCDGFTAEEVAVLTGR